MQGVSGLFISTWSRHTGLIGIIKNSIIPIYRLAKWLVGDK